jgi:hypothetical protein
VLLSRLPAITTSPSLSISTHASWTGSGVVMVRKLRYLHKRQL